MADHFNNFFSSVGKEIQDNIPPTLNPYLQQLQKRSVHYSTMKLNKSTGPNTLSLKVLKSVKGIISVPLCELIIKSFTSGVFPSMCKIAKIVPIFKNQSRLYYNNYRPTSLLSNIGKVIEKKVNCLLEVALALRQLNPIRKKGP